MSSLNTKTLSHSLSESHHTGSLFALKILLTAVCYLGFGIGAVCFLFFVCLPISLLPLRKKMKQYITRRALCFFLNIFKKVMNIFRLVKIEYFGFDKCKNTQGVIFVSNHPGLLDALFLLPKLPDTVCFTKSEIKQNLLYGTISECLGFISKSTNSSSLDAAIDALQSNKSILIFPESTRSPAPKVLKDFNRGASILSLRSGKDIVPIVISCDNSLLSKTDSWYKAAQFDIDLKIQLYYDKVFRIRNKSPYLNQNIEKDIGSERKASKLIISDIKEFFVEKLENNSY